MKKDEFCDYKVYLHRRKDNDLIFYVGKGRRWRENQKHNRNQHWKNIVNKYGYYVEIVSSNLTNSEACDLERKLIKKYGFENLVNYTIGGEGSDGYKHTEESLLNMKGRVFSDEHKEKLSKAKTEKNPKFWKGKKRKLETRVKISESLSLPFREECEKMLIENIDRKVISSKTGATLIYLRGLANRLRKNGYEIKILKN
jgi:hypothetical protein